MSVVGAKPSSNVQSMDVCGVNGAGALCRIKVTTSITLTGFGAGRFVEIMANVLLDADGAGGAGGAIGSNGPSSYGINTSSLGTAMGAVPLVGNFKDKLSGTLAALMATQPLPSTIANQTIAAELTTYREAATLDYVLRNAIEGSNVSSFARSIRKFMTPT